MIGLSQISAGPYTVDGLHPVVLICSHVQLRDDIAWLSNLEDFDIGGIVGVDLLGVSKFRRGRNRATKATLLELTCLIMYMRPINTKN